MYSPERDSRGAFPAALPLKRTHGTRIMVLTTTSTSYVVSARGFRSAADAAKAPCELDPLERLPCDGLVLQRPARCPAAGRSEAENRRKIDLPAEARNVPSRPLMNVTITG